MTRADWRPELRANMTPQSQQKNGQCGHAVAGPSLMQGPPPVAGRSPLRQVITPAEVGAGAGAVRGPSLLLPDIKISRRKSLKYSWLCAIKINPAACHCLLRALSMLSSNNGGDLKISL
jgi:hypothetical protein